MAKKKNSHVVGVDVGWPRIENRSSGDSTHESNNECVCEREREREKEREREERESERERVKERE